MNVALYLIVLLAWGSSWFAITFQLGDVAPQVSIVWRFLLASFILFYGVTVVVLSFLFLAESI